MLNTLFGSKIDMAIERIRFFEKPAIQMNPDGYYVCFSGGKDSIVILDLVRKSGCKHTANYNHTGIDPPELVYFIRKHYPDIKTHMPRITMWQLWRDKMMPPTRKVRYCCEELKERGGEGSMCVTGIRWEESSKRSKRKMTETCMRSKQKAYLHPIIDWESTDVWDYIRENQLPYPSLYDEGWKRIGCIGCPMSGPSGMKRDFARWPKYYAAYSRAAAAVAAANRMRKGHFYGMNGERHLRWEDGESMMKWWIDGKSGEAELDGGLFEQADNYGQTE